ncbi:MAG: LysR family transcriptional regulator [Sulfuriferula sp.]
MDKLHLMKVFIAVAEALSFAAAARNLSMSPPAVTRAITTLENHLKTKLLIRTTRHVRLSEAGLRYLEDVKRICQTIVEADEVAMGVNAEPRGHLTITAPALFGKMYVLPGMIDYLQRNPAMSVSALLLDRVVSMLDEGVDVAIRIGELADSSMNAIRVGQVRRVLCASPNYLEQHGTPKNLTELSTHTLITASNIGNLWKFGDQSSATRLQIQPRLSVTTHDAAIDAAIHGLGITRVLSYQIAASLDSGSLSTLLDDYQPPSMPIHILHSEGRHTSAKVRAFVDMMVRQLRENPALH